MDQSEQNIRNKITIITFICSVFVIFIHTYNLEVYGITSGSTGIAKVTYEIETYWASVTRSTAVKFFFFISGLLFYRNFEINRLTDKWKRRFHSVVLPYLVWCTIYYLFFALITNIPIIYSHMNVEAVTQLSLLAWVRSLWSDCFYAFWFLKNLIIFICLAPIIWLFLKNHSKKLPTGFIAFFLIEIAMAYFDFGDSGYCNGGAVYLAGSYIGLNCSEQLKFKNKPLSIASCVYIALTFLTAFKFWNIVTQIIFFLAVWFALDLQDLGQKKLPWWMSITFFTYVAHGMCLEVFEKLFLIVFGTKPIFALIDYLFIPWAALTGLILVAWFLQRYMPKLWNVLTGGR